MSICISTADFREFDKQIVDAIESLREDFEFIRDMRSYAGVEHAILDFGIAWKDTVTQTDRLPAELLRLAGELNLDIDISHYPVAPVPNRQSGDAD